ncbi:MAG: RNA polymerase sigma factor [Gemmatimonadetes bacterium]|nr:RNA polymerase sigma factor [Gemmatimonadota bacterium]
MTRALTTPHRSDRELSRRITGEGDEEAFRTLYRRYTPALYPFILRILGGAGEDAEDVVQETWLRAVRALEGFRWESSFRTWLMGIGLNRAREVLRRRARRDRSTVTHRDIPVRPPPVAEKLDVERALTCLPEGYREVLILHDVEGFTHPEISQRLDIAVGTSKSQLFHARRALRRLLDPAEEAG